MEALVQTIAYKDANGNWVKIPYSYEKGMMTTNNPEYRIVEKVKDEEK